MSASPISDKELASLLRLAAAMIESGEGDPVEMAEDLDHAANLLDERRGISHDGRRDLSHWQF